MLKRVIALAALAQAVAADVPVYGQCGGINHTGETTCVSGSACVYQNDWYSQCLPGATVTTSSRSSTTTSKTSTSSSSSKTSTTTTKTSTTVTTTTTSGPVATGFVKTSGQRFTLNGSNYVLVGHNSYWLAQLGSDTDINAAFADIKKTGATTVRTWGFNEVTSPSGTYYQIWSGATPSINTGSTGLAKFDTVVSYAKANGLRLIVALTNNWADYGGMDVYVKQITGSGNHDYFYTNSAVKTAFKNYISAFVGRYKNEPGILAWELANEPRCKGSTGTSSGTCTTATITAWIKEISAYIKTVDSNHLVAIGDEGFGLSGSTSYPYTEYEGLNFATNLAISTIDFAFHSYPEHWGTESAADPTGWGTAWIKDHATIQKSANKPVILEEYGVASANQASTYTSWLNEVVSSGVTGSLVWQAGSHLPSGSTTHDDGYAIYPEDPVYPILTSHAAALKARG